jgi:hypothetical protein
MEISSGRAENRWHGKPRPTHERPADAKGLAKLDCRMRHDLTVKCVDASTRIARAGYSPMTLRILPARVRGRKRRVRSI